MTNDIGIFSQDEPLESHMPGMVFSGMWGSVRVLLIFIAMPMGMNQKYYICGQAHGGQAHIHQQEPTTRGNVELR